MIYPSPSPLPTASDEKSRSTTHSPPAQDPTPRSPKNAQSRRKQEIRQHFDGMMAQRRSGPTFDDLSDFDFSPASASASSSSSSSSDMRREAPSELTSLDIVDAPKHNITMPTRKKAKGAVMQTIIKKREEMEAAAGLPSSPALLCKAPEPQPQDEHRDTDSDTDSMRVQPGPITRRSSSASSSSERPSTESITPQRQGSRAQSISLHINEMLHQQGIQRATWDHIDIPFDPPENQHARNQAEAEDTSEESEPDFWHLSQDSTPDAVENRAANTMLDGPLFCPSGEKMRFGGRRHDDESRDEDADCASKTSTSDASSARDIRPYAHRYDTERSQLEASMAVAVARCRVCVCVCPFTGLDDKTKLPCQHERSAYERERERQRQLEEATTSPSESQSQGRPAPLPLCVEDPVFPSSSDAVSRSVRRQVETRQARLPAVIRFVDSPELGPTDDELLELLEGGAYPYPAPCPHALPFDDRGVE